MATNGVHKPPMKPIFCQNFTTIFLHNLAKDGPEKRPNTSPIGNANFDVVRKRPKFPPQNISRPVLGRICFTDSVFDTPEAQL